MDLESLLTTIEVHPGRLAFPDSWVGHIPFASWLMRRLQPAVFVELGTHSGNSYFAFCQAVQEAGLPTRCHAVDTWLGDDYTGFYSEQVFQDVNSHHQKHYGAFSQILRMTFDEALAHFADGSIDLLHIDGMHSYEAVRHDFETWLPKLSPHAVVLLHDTTVHEREFGVWKFWEELTSRYPLHFEFTHANGLGVIQLSAGSGTFDLGWLRPDSAERRLLSNFFTALGGQTLEQYHHAMLVKNVLELEKRQAEFLASEEWKTVLLIRWLARPNSWRAKLLTRVFNFLFSKYERAMEAQNERNLSLIASSQLFDRQWYLNQNPDVARSEMDPLVHFLISGGMEGRDPGPQFCSNWYLDTYEDVKRAGINPLVHYLIHGKKEGRAIRPVARYSR